MHTRQVHERWLAPAVVAGRRPTSRRGLLLGSAKVVGGGALALAAVGVPLGHSRRSALAQEEVDVSTPVGVLNYALTLELLENAFYRDGLGGFAAGDFDAGIFDNLAVIGGHEAAHVATLTDTIVQLGGTPVAEVAYDFAKAFADPADFLATAQALENTGVAAYTGAAQFLIDDDALLTAALTIHGVEARHAAYLNRINGAQPFPDAIDGPLTPDQVMAIAMPFIVTAGPGEPGGTGEGAGQGDAGGPADEVGSAAGGNRGAGGTGASGRTATEAGGGTATGGAGQMNLPNTGSGSAYRTADADDDRLHQGLGLLGLAGVGAAAAAAFARRGSVMVAGGRPEVVGVRSEVGESRRAERRRVQPLPDWGRPGSGGDPATERPSDPDRATSEGGPRRGG